MQRWDREGDSGRGGQHDREMAQEGDSAMVSKGEGEGGSGSTSEHEREGRVKAELTTDACGMRCMMIGSVWASS